MTKHDLIRLLQALPEDLDIPVQELNGCITGAQNQRNGTCDITFSTTRLNATEVTKTLLHGKPPAETNTGIVIWINNVLFTDTISSMENPHETASTGHQEG